MSIVIDSVMPGNTGRGVTVVTSDSFNFTNTAGDLMIVGACLSGTPLAAFTSVKYNTFSLSQYGVTSTYDSGNCAMGIFYLYGGTVSTGTNSLALVGTGTVGGNSALTWGAITVTGADLSSLPIIQGTFNTSSGSTATGTLTGVTLGNMTLDVTMAGSSMTNDNRTLSWVNNLSNLSAGGNGRSAYANGGVSGSVTHTHAISSSDSFGMLLIELKAAAAGIQDTLDWRSPKSVWIRGYDPYIINV